MHQAADAVVGHADPVEGWRERAEAQVHEEELLEVREAAAIATQGLRLALGGPLPRYLGSRGLELRHKVLEELPDGTGDHSLHDDRAQALPLRLAFSGAKLRQRPCLRARL